jgi:hypothetical protein
MEPPLDIKFPEGCCKREDGFCKREAEDGCKSEEEDERSGDGNIEDEGKRNGKALLSKHSDREEGIKNGKDVFSLHSERIEEVFIYWLRTASDSDGRREEEGFCFGRSKEFFDSEIRIKGNMRPAIIERLGEFSLVLGSRIPLS